MERQIGEIFRAGAGHTYQCVAETNRVPGCKTCAMWVGGNCVASLLSAGECAELSRKDRTPVRFVECNLPED